MTTRSKENITERKGKLADLDRSFDLKFWQDQTPQARFDATWELIVHAWVWNFLMMIWLSRLFLNRI